MPVSPRRGRRSWVPLWQAGEVQPRHLAAIATAVLLASAAAIALLFGDQPAGSRSGSGTVMQVRIVPAPAPAASQPSRETEPQEVASVPSVSTQEQGAENAVSTPAEQLEATERREAVEQELERLQEEQSGAELADLLTSLEQPPPLVFDEMPGSYGGAADFQRLLFDHIRQYRRYPDAALTHRLEGVVKLVFVMNRNGTLLEAWVADSSGYPLLDQSAIDMIWRADPLPTVPANLPDHLRITLPVEFSAEP